MSNKPIQDLERRSYLDDEQSYLRVIASNVIDDNSVSNKPIQDLRRRSYYDDGINTHVRIVGVEGGSGQTCIKDYITEPENILVPEFCQYIVNESITIDGAMTIDGALVVS